MTKNFRQRLPAAFVPAYKQLIDGLVPILQANLAYSELTSQILVFFHSNMMVLGLDMLQTVCTVVGNCASVLPYTRQVDVIRILMLAVEQFRLESIPVLQIALAPLLEKAIQTPAPQRHVSDEDRDIVHTN